MHRFFADERGIQDGAAFLSGEDARHALRVLRLAAGDEVELVCPPARYRACIADTEGGVVRLRILQALESTEASTRVTLYQGLPKADKMEWIVQKSTELGAHAIVPVRMERSVVRLEGEDACRKAERWQKIAREAVKQCGRVCVPAVRTPQKLTALEAEMRALDALIVPWEDARDGSIRECLTRFAPDRTLNVGILIGPEGGISPDEAWWLREKADARLVTLGPRVLRTETAALAALTAVMALRGELEAAGGPQARPEEGGQIPNREEIRKS